MTLRLPDGKRGAVCFTFDCDAFSVWLGFLRVPLSKKGILSRGELFARATPKILNLLDEYDLKCTFFVVGHTADSFPDVTGEIHDRGHEIALHGAAYCHTLPDEFKSYEDEKAQMDKSINALKSITGESPLGYRSSSGDTGHSSHTLNLLLERGFTYDSSLQGGDFHPYKCRIGDEVSLTEPFRPGKEINIIEFPFGWHLDDFVYFELSAHTQILSAPSRVFEIWIEDFDYMYRKEPNGVFMPIMHPQVIGRGGRIAHLERVIQYVKKFPDVWITRLVDVAKTWRD